jgi:hypothetical protein
MQRRALLAMSVGAIAATAGNPFRDAGGREASRPGSDSGSSAMPRRA